MIRPLPMRRPAEAVLPSLPGSSPTDDPADTLPPPPPPPATELATTPVPGKEMDAGGNWHPMLNERI